VAVSLDQDKAVAASGALDRELLNAYTQGDEAAFESLVRQYFGLIYNVALRQVRDPHLAQEVAQSTFIILARKAAGLPSRVPLCGWLLRTTRFICKDALKTQRRRLELEQAFEAHVFQQCQGDEFAETVLLEEALMVLPPADQSCVVARFLEGKSVREVGETLGISEDAAQKKISRSLKRMRRFLSRQGVRVSDTALSALLATRLIPPSLPGHAVNSALHVIHAAGQGQLAGGDALMLAQRGLRLLTARGWAAMTAKLALPLVLLVGGGWASWSLAHAHDSTSVAFKPSDPRVEELGKAWSRVVIRTAAAKHRFAAIPGPNDPNFQAFTTELTFAVNETERISAQFYAGLNPAQEPEVLAEFLTVEMRETLALDTAQQSALLTFIRNALARGPTLKDSIKTMAQSAKTETTQIKALLSPSQRALYDRVYGADGLCLFQFIKVTPAGG
jgi:RNA polymerase sigma factor (sigma-70 family)